MYIFNIFMSARAPVRRYYPRQTSARRVIKAQPIKGRGAYQSRKSKPSRRVVSAQSQPPPSIGQQIGSKVGGWIGDGLQQLVKHFTGLGAYSVKENIFLTGRLPEMRNKSDVGNVIRFQEFLGDVITSGTAGAFATNTYLINAANRRTFPWLSQVAQNYEQFCVEGIIFEFRSTSASALNSTNTALGSVIMATQYDVADEDFASKSEMLNYEYSNSCKPSDCMVHMIECAPKQTTVEELYCNWDLNDPSGTDPRLYNLGRFTIATVGFQGTSVNIGELHVTYQIRLLKPKLFASLGSSSLYKVYSTGNVSVNTYSNTNPLGLVTLLGFNNTAPIETLELYDNTGIRIERVASNNKIVFPPSNARLFWRIEIIWQGAAATPVLPALTYTEMTQTSISQQNEGVVGSVTQVLELGVRQNATGVEGSIKFGAAGTLPSGNNAVIVRIWQVPPNSTAI